MKRINVNAYQVALVFKNGEYKKMLTAGKYWFWGNEQVRVYEKTMRFMAPIELNILLQDEGLAEQLIVITVKDNEIALQYENGLLNEVFTAGRYVYWKGIVNYDFVIADISKIEIERVNLGRFGKKCHISFYEGNQFKTKITYDSTYPEEADFLTDHIHLINRDIIIQ